MKSLRYLLLKQPHTLDDCLDFSRSAPPRHVQLELKVDECVDEFRELIQYMGCFQWEWDDRAICCVEIYGGVSMAATALQQEKILAVANGGLRRRLKEMARRGIEIIGDERRFELPEGSLNKGC